MPQTATLPASGGGGGGFEGLSTPVKLGLIGGGVGLAYFLWRKASSGGGGGSGNAGDSGYGIPNTAVMLGSLQQEMLDLKGEVGSGNVDLSNLITGGFGNLGSMMDAQTAVFQTSLTDLQNNVLDNQNSNTQAILTGLGARFDVLSQLVATSSGAEIAVIQSFQDSTAKGLNAIAAQQNAELAGLGALGTTVTQGQQALAGQILSGQLGTQQQLSALGQQISGLTQTTPANSSIFLSTMNNTRFYSTEGTGYYVTGGKLYSISKWDTWAHQLGGVKSLGSTQMSNSQLAPFVTTCIDCG